MSASNLAILKNLIENHDSEYMKSDDKTAFNKGAEEAQTISNLSAELFKTHPDKVNEFWIRKYNKKYKEDSKKEVNMNIYEKLQTCRCELQAMNLKKSGNNSYAGYQYYELGDFLPTINTLFLKHKLCSCVTFIDSMATLYITDSEKPDAILTFTSPMVKISLKGLNDIQNLGAVETYQRRYLYMSALEIVEHDPIDATTGKEAPPDPKKPLVDNNRPSPDFNEPQDAPQGSNESKPTLGNGKVISEAQRKRMYAIGKGIGWTDQAMKAALIDYGFEHSKDVTKVAYETVCDLFGKPMPAIYKELK